MTRHRFIHVFITYPTLTLAVGFILWIVLTGGRP